MNMTGFNPLCKSAKEQMLVKVGREFSNNVEKNKQFSVGTCQVGSFISLLCEEEFTPRQKPE